MKNKPLTQRQLQRNRLITKVRYVVERAFGSQVRWFCSKITISGISQSSCLAYFTSHGVQPEKIAKIVYAKSNHAENVCHLDENLPL